ncbi:MAG: hypothetical protein IJ424_01575 [Oscillospiraceae bacterium]|nr:hypothetical protein [Oscillospiraceae bacterium]
MEQPTFCGHEEHIHTEDCYTQLDVSANLICTPDTINVHNHTAECFDELGNIVCGMADCIGHTHNEDCYDANGNLVCTLLETIWHVHDETCVSEVRPVATCGVAECDVHIHDDSCYMIHVTISKNLVCGLEETFTHTHSPICYDELGNIICGLEEASVHTHGTECFDELGNLICTLEETVQHMHADSCYEITEEKILICTLEEGVPHSHTAECYEYPASEKVLICTLEEALTHVHDVVCFDELGNLICGLEETFVHTHGVECFDELGNLVCLIPETASHIHADECYIEIPATELICRPENVLVHTHTEACYDELGSIICGLADYVAHVHDINYCYDKNGSLVCPFLETQEHVHGAECFAAKEQPLTCTLEENEEHTHSNLCYGTWVLTCEGEEHSHILSCFSDPEADLETQEDWEKTLENVSLTGVWADDVVAIAQSQLGYAESALNYKVLDDGVTACGYTRYGQWYGIPYDDWSAMFASFCLNYAEVESITLNKNCEEWVNDLSAGWQNLYRSADEYIPTHGDLVFFDLDGDAVADRVGIVAQVTSATETTPATIITIEGDCLNQVGQMTYVIGDPTIMGYGTLPKQEETTYNFDYFDGTVEVDVTLPESSGVPSNAILTVTPIEVFDENYYSLLAQAQAAVDGSVSQIKFYDISFYTPEMEYIPVSDFAQVTMRFNEGEVNPAADTVILHYDENESAPVVLDGVNVEQQVVVSVDTYTLNSSIIETTDTVVTFGTPGFSVFAVVEVSTEADPCEILEVDITDTKDVAPDNNTIFMYKLPEQVTVNDPNNENTVVVHIKGTAPGTFRTWLCNDYSNRRASSVQTMNASGEFEYFIEYTANSPESDSVTVANYVEFKDQADLNLTHVGVYYGTLAEYEAERSKFGGSADGNGEEVEITPGEVICAGDFSLVLNSDPNPLNVAGAQGFGEGDYSYTGITGFENFSSFKNIDVKGLVGYAKNPDTVFYFEFTGDVQPTFTAQFNKSGSNNASFIVNPTVIYENGSGVASIKLNDLYNAYISNGGNEADIINFNIETSNTISVTKAWIEAPTIFEDDEDQEYELVNSTIGGKGTIPLTDGVIVDSGWYPLLSDNQEDIQKIAQFLQLPGAKIKITYFGNADLDVSLQGGKWNLVNTSSQTPEVTSISGTQYKTVVFDVAPLLEAYKAVDDINDLKQLGINGGGNIIYKFEIIVPTVEDVLFESEEGDSLGLVNTWDGFGIGAPVNGIEIGDYTLNDIKMLAEAAKSGEDIELIIEFSYSQKSSGGPLMETQFNAWDDENNLQVGPNCDPIDGGKYQTRLKVKDLVDKLEAKGLTIEDISNIGVQLWCSDFELHKVSFTMPQATYDKLERDPAETDLVTNLDGQIAAIVAVNNETNSDIIIYPAVSSTVSGNGLIGADLDRFYTENGEYRFEDDDIANGDSSGNRIVWEFEAAEDIGSYYIKCANVFGSIDNPNDGLYLNISSTGLSLSTTKQPIEVVKCNVTAADNVVFTDNVVSLRAKVDGKYYYIQLSGNNGGNNFISSSSNDTSYLGNHFVIVDIIDEDVCELRDMIDSMPDIEDFEAEVAAKGNFQAQCDYRDQLREIAIKAKAAYDVLNTSTDSDAALQLNFVGAERIKKLIEDYEFLWRPNPNVVPSVALNATVKVFNYDPTVNSDYILSATTTDGSQIEPHYAFYNWSEAEKSEDGKLEPSSGDSDRPIISSTIGSNGYPVITQIKTVVEKQDTNSDGTPKVDSSGNPVMVDDVQYVTINNGGRELDYLFSEGSTYHKGTMTDGGGLFQQDADGYYYYYSDTNAAWYNEAENKFVLYDVVVRPESQPNQPDGSLNTMESLPDHVSNFLPFNPIVDENGNSLVMYDHPVEGDAYYEVPSSVDGRLSDTTYLNGVTDLWFGMNIEYDFFIPEDAKVNGNPMVFDFHGDDDVFVYIDDVLVLDIGGCHAALDGNINFATGEVYYQTNEYGGKVNTTLGEIFAKVKDEAYMEANFEKDANGNYTTFKDFTTHNLKFFYMERGGSISYCGIRFNLPSIPEYDLMVAKELVDSEGNHIESDNDYTFRVVDANDTSKPFFTVGTPFDIYNNGVLVGRGSVDANGIFTLKAGQTAVFPTLSDADKENYIVQELMPIDVDDMYGKIEYRTDGTPEGVLKNVTDTQTMLLNYYSTLLLADECEHTNCNYYKVDDATHRVYCTSCNMDVATESHDFTVWSYASDTEHKGSCSRCGAEIRCTSTNRVTNCTICNPNGESHTHSYTTAVTTEPTCIASGVRTYTCSCNDTYTETIPATGHTWDTGVTDNGVTTYTCTANGCGATKTEAVAPIGPATETINGVEYVVYQTGALNSLDNDDGNKATTVVVTNVMTTKLGELKITKDGDVDSNEIFDMQVLVGSGTVTRALLTPLTQGTAYTVGTETRYVGANGIIQIKKGEVAVINGIAPGTFVEVIELLNADQDYTPSYTETILYDYEEGAIGSELGENDGKVIIGEGDTVQITVTNVKNVNSISIPISKQIPGNSNNSASEFRFDVEKGTWEDGKWTKSASLDSTLLSVNAWSSEVVQTSDSGANHHVVLGYSETDNGTFYYRISEYNAGGNFIYDETFYIVEVVVSNGNIQNVRVLKNGDENSEYYTGTGTDMPALAFVNKFMAKLVIYKEVVGTDTSGEFEFKLKVNYNVDGQDTVFSEFKGYEVDSEGYITFKLKHNQSIEFMVPLWSNIEVKESNNLGCSTSYRAVVSSETETRVYSDSGKTASFNIDRGANVTFTNVRGFELPRTGGPGIYLYASGGILLLAIFAVLLYNRIKCGKEDHASS